MSEDIAKVRRSFQGPPGKNQCLLPYSCTCWQHKAQEAWSYSDNSNNTGNDNSLRLSSPSYVPSTTHSFLLKVFRHISSLGLHNSPGREALILR